MAIGIGKMIGFRFPENFNNPYISQSITEFWRRWHISLGNWMRNYLYIPLGGNRVTSKSRLYFNLGFVFLVSGLWHGASWTFVIWGAYHGVFLILDRIFLIDMLSKTNKIFRTLLTFLIVLIGWVFFRVDNLSNAITYLSKMFDFTSIRPTFGLFDKEFYVMLFIGTFFAFFTYTGIGQKIQSKVFFDQYGPKQHILLAGITITLLILSIGSITSNGYNPFIYFRF